MENIFENCITNTDQGNLGMSHAISYFMSNGYVVCSPLTENQNYDLIVDNGDQLLKVQVKTSGYRIGVNKDKFQVTLRTSGGNTVDYTVKHFDSDSLDLLFILLSNGYMYLIPTAVLTNKTSLNIDIPSYEKYRVDLQPNCSMISKEAYDKEINQRDSIISELRSKLDNLYDSSTSPMTEDRHDFVKSQRKVQRPSYKTLTKEIRDTNYTAVGKKYGVSDNAVRRWVRMYEKYGEKF